MTDPRLPRGLIPVPRTRLIGREAEQQAARAYLLDQAAPLLTLTGPGGVGKTHLALNVAMDVAPHFSDGVVWVDLAPVSDARLVAAVAASAFGISATSEQAILDQLRLALHTRQMLLLLDNCEHVRAEAADLVASLLARCPALQVLATSRAPLRLREEQRFEVAPLPLPAESSSPTLVAQSAAVQLFGERARAVRATFALSQANAGTVGALCRALDGLPLAIELAAARSTILDPEALLAQMHDRLSLLTRGARNLPPRQQTMAATIAWSYDLLDPGAQALLRRLAVFVGGFTLEAAYAVGVASGESSREVLGHLEALVAQSLVQRIDTSEGSRFSLLETIRAFALERLVEADEADEARDAHAMYFAACADRSFRLRPDVPEVSRFTLQQKKVERANIRAAIAHVIAAGDGDRALRLAGAFAWNAQMRPQEGRAWLEWALDHTPATASAARGHALAELAYCRWAQGDFTPAASLADTGRGVGEQVSNSEVIAEALHIRGLIALSQQQGAQARLLLAQALEHWRELGEHAEEAEALQLLAAAEHELGDETTAAHHADEALALYRQIGYGVGIAIGLNRIGRLALDRGDDHAAVAAYGEALQRCIVTDNRLNLVGTLCGLSELASRHGQPDIAAALVGGVDAIAQAFGTARLGTAGATYDRAVAASSAALGAQRFSACRAAGERSSLDDTVLLARRAIACVLSDNPRRPAQPIACGGSQAPEEFDDVARMLSVAAGSAAAVDLTFREQEVLALLCRRLTDAEIGERLFLSPRTASRHVGNILRKLGAANRREAAAIAARWRLI